MKLALGTAQFGMPYGVSNKSGQVSLTAVEAILDESRSLGIDTIDTAMAYGESERVLGEVGVQGFKVISKLPSVDAGENEDVLNCVMHSVESSLGKLRLESLDTILLHRPMELLGDSGDRIYESLLELKAQGLAKKIGVSVYDPSELAALIETFQLDVVQLPLNLFDQRFLRSGCLEDLDRRGVEIHARSVFLQGLLLMNSTSRPTYFDRWEHEFEMFDNWLESSGLTGLEACIGFLYELPEVFRLVVGVESKQHLLDIALASRKPATVEEFSGFEDLELISPNRWNL